MTISDMTIFRMTSILVSRFLLDLQAVNQKSLKLAREDPLYSSMMDDSSEDDGRGVGSLVLAGFDVVGSLGASLAPGVHVSSLLGDAESGEDDLERDVPEQSMCVDNDSVRPV